MIYDDGLVPVTAPDSFASHRADLRYCSGLRFDIRFACLQINWDRKVRMGNEPPAVNFFEAISNADRVVHFSSLPSWFQ